jgi:hypothetical protein
LEHALAEAGIKAPERQPDAIYQTGDPGTYRFKAPADAAFAGAATAFAAAGVPLAVAQSLIDTFAASRRAVADLAPQQRAEQ